MGHVIGKGRYGTRTYPETGGRASALALSRARNSAFGPAAPQALGGVAPIGWQTVESTGAGGTSVPVTPVSSSSGRVRVAVMVGVTGATADMTISVGVEVNGEASVPFLSALQDVPTGLSAEIPFLIDLDLTTFGAGPTYNISVIVAAIGGGTAELTTRRSSIDIQELPPATG